MAKTTARFKTLSFAKRSFGAIFISIVALLPLFSFWQVSSEFIKPDSRKVINMPIFNTRSIDANNNGTSLFHEPIVTINFDDGRETVYSQAFLLLQKYGIHTTQYLISGASKDESYMSDNQIDQMYGAGHEIACHTVNHLDVTTLDDNKLTYELTQCQKTFEKYGPITDFASPYGHTDDKSIKAVKKYYLSSRNTNGDITNGVSDKDVNITSNFDRYNIISASIRSDTTIDQLKAAVEYTIKNNGWLVLVYHQIENGGNATFGLDSASLDKQLNYLSSQPVKIVTMKQALTMVGK